MIGFKSEWIQVR